MCQAQPVFEAYAIDLIKLYSCSQEELEGGRNRNYQSSEVNALLPLSQCHFC